MSELEINVATTPSTSHDDASDALFDAFKENRSTMFRIARQIAGAEYAADVVQDVISKAWERQGRFDASRGPIRQYLLMLTRSASIDHTRSVIARRARDLRAYERPETWASDDALRRLIRNEQSLRLSAALGVLSKDERAIIIAAFSEQRSTYRQIALDFSIPEGTVKSRIRSALHKLRAALREAPESDLTATV